MDTKEKKKNQNTPKEHKRKAKDLYGINVLILLIILSVTIFGISTYIQYLLDNVNNDSTKYTYHYVFISRSADSYTSDHIYEEAFKYGKQNGAYVEDLKTNSNSDYTEADYIEMATSMKVDGIILEASEDEDLKNYINEAEKQGIPTVTILSDCEDSNRKSFIELGNYNLGREYARAIINITRTRTPKVTLLLDEEKDGHDDILNGFTETLSNEGNHLSVDLTIENVGGLPNFRISDLVKETLSSDSPDILICITENDTKIAYQTIRDYDLVGKTNFIGYGISEHLLKAVRDGEISALIDADAEQMGTMCIDALIEFNRNGVTTEHLISEDTVITTDNVGRYLDEE